MDTSDLNECASLFPELKKLPPLVFIPKNERQIVNEKKFLVFESCLDNLVRKVKCQYSEDCDYMVQTFHKKIEGSYCKITGTCYQGHYFTIFESQPRVGRYCSGNILIAAAILFSGQNFVKTKEFLNILGLQSIAEKTYYRYQSLFLFPAIDKAWKSNKEEMKDYSQNKPLCIAGDGQCDSPGHSAKYCVYTLMNTVNDNILDFEVIQKTQCASSFAMEKLGFETVMDRIIAQGSKIKIFASDRLVSIRKKMRTDYSMINHQFDVWHYAKSPKKKLINASKLKFCKEITPWVDKIVLHFWWCIKTFNHNPELLKEKWLSVLHHIADEHEWDGRLYSACMHSPIEEQNNEEIFWLSKEKPSYKNIMKIVSNDVLIKDLQHLVHNCHTGLLENFHSLALKFRSKRIHFGIDAMEARTKLAALSRNHNVGRQQAVVQVSRTNTEPVGTLRTRVVLPKGNSRWIIRNIFEKISVKFLEDISVDVLKICNHSLLSEWESRAPTVPPNIANIEKPNEDEVKNNKSADTELQPHQRCEISIKDPYWYLYLKKK
ncbi:uncharacterized protein LOC122925115 [Bufo gargarizans]|uniref:uncharacterized protein LOC122925115 n=1 Tax=Bufo gargarizans TaxID=30331 RepID=UPI001CF3CDBB|nr:uncharacterized protein LOC122925115 [Bufo gargarizans]